MEQAIDPKKLYVIARAPFDVYYEGHAEAVSAKNRVGDFDILAGHADFFSILSAGEVAILPTDNKEPVIISITNGMITVRDNSVMIFLNI